MKRSSDRILTSHVGSLPRPPDLLKLIKAKVAGQPYDEKELAALILMIATTNLFNRLNVATRQVAGGTWG